MNQQQVFLREGAIVEIGSLLKQSPIRRLFFVVDNVAYTASGARAALEPYFRPHSITRFSDFELNPKLEDVDRGVKLYREADPEMIIALGGGTAIDLAKLIGAVACQQASAHAIVTGKATLERTGQPLIAIPTTAGTGSEATHFAVVYVQGKKVSLADPALLPNYAIVDSQLTHSLPANITAATGLDAFCQAVESLWAVGATDPSVAYAEQALRLASEHLVEATCHPTADARQAMMEAAHLAGKAINISKTTACHALSYAITSRYATPHGMAVALSLSPMLAFNAAVTDIDCCDPRGAAAVRKRISLILEVLSADSVPAACHKIEQLIAAVGCPTSLGQVGVTTEEEIEWIAQQVNPERMSNNPRAATPESLVEVLTSSPLT